MANGPLFSGAWARCKKHKTLLEANETECLKCRILARNLSLVPPFRVYCINGEWGEVHAGKDYEVIWVITDGRRDHGDLQGYVFRHDDDSLNDHVFDPSNFIPFEFFDKENKSDKWDSSIKETKWPNVDYNAWEGMC